MEYSETLLRMTSVCEKLGLGRATIYRLIADENFPRPIRVSNKAVSWVESEIDEWVKERPRG